MKRKVSVEEQALVKAAKLICNLKSGLCPLHEPEFCGCPYECTEDIRPWQCWIIYLTALVDNGDRDRSKTRFKWAA